MAVWILRFSQLFAEIYSFSGVSTHFLTYALENEIAFFGRKNIFLNVFSLLVSIGKLIFDWFFLFGNTKCCVTWQLQVKRPEPIQWELSIGHEFPFVYNAEETTKVVIFVLLQFPQRCRQRETCQLNWQFIYKNISILSIHFCSNWWNLQIFRTWSCQVTQHFVFLNNKNQSEISFPMDTRIEKTF